MSEKPPQDANEKPKGGMTRRGFLKGGAAAISTGMSLAGPAGLGYVKYKEYEREKKRSAWLEAMVEGYEAFANLRYDEVVFIDTFGRPIDGPMKIDPIEGVSPGSVNEIGLLDSGIAGSWLRVAREQLKKNHPDLEIDAEKAIPRQYNVVQSFLAALNEDDEPELVEGIKSGKITRLIDIIEYFMEKPVVGTEHLSRLEYVQETIVFDDHIPLSVQQELRKLIPGLCAQESKFNNGLVSRNGAKGIFQFMPSTWKHLGFEEDDINSLSKQVEAAGKHFSEIYNQLMHYSGKELEKIKEVFFPHGGFEEYFLVPVMINSYNAGGKRVSDAVISLAQRFHNADDVQRVFGRQPNELGHDVFIVLSQLARTSEKNTLDAYKDDAYEYVPRIYAFAKVIGSMRVHEPPRQLPDYPSEDGLIIEDTPAPHSAPKPPPRPTSSLDETMTSPLPPKRPEQ